MLHVLRGDMALATRQQLPVLLCRRLAFLLRADARVLDNMVIVRAAAVAESAADAVLQKRSSHRAAVLRAAKAGRL